MNPPISIAVHGAAGRMGQAILRLAAGSRDLRIAAALVRAQSGVIGESLRAGLGNDAPAIAYAAVPAAIDEADVLLDFSEPRAFDAALGLAVEHGCAFVSGTTGLTASQMSGLDDAAGSIAVLWSSNFSLGVAVLARLVAEAARALPDWDCEIVEAHHARKIDAPSGTALALGREAARARGLDFARVARLTRDAESGPRTPGEIGFAVTRAGDIVGEHAALFATSGERLELHHRAGNRDIFAHGALVAARWIASRDPGRYALADVMTAATR